MNLRIDAELEGEEASPLNFNFEGCCEERQMKVLATSRARFPAAMVSTTSLHR